jgi:hyaluronan synthase
MTATQQPITLATLAEWRRRREANAESLARRDNEETRNQFRVPTSLTDVAGASPNRAALEALLELAKPQSPHLAEESVNAVGFCSRPVGSFRDDGGLHSGDHGWHTLVLPSRQDDHGSVAQPQYRIPDVTFRRLPYLMWLPLVAITAGSVMLHRGKFTVRAFDSPWLLVMWGISLGFVLLQLVLAWRQKPFTVTRRQGVQLAALKVTVVIPCYNEDPAILDRTIYSLFRQTRLPGHVVIVDDGSTCDYTAVRTRWEQQRSAGTRFTWIRQTNAGKKHAQAAAWACDPDADVFVTIDSDSALDQRAIEEGLKPFADPGIVSVAGLEMAYNFGTNLLTRAIAARSLGFQLFAMSAQSTANGNVIINPGAFSLYRAWLIRKIVPAYLGETFFGVPVTLGDDTALTMFALSHGRAVHQPTAVSMPVYPETLSHHLRQWTRWMRASTIRTFWRIRYLPIRSYGWVFVVYQQWAFFASVAVSVAIPLAWPASRNLAIAGGIALLVWPWAVAVRLATVRRSDQGLGAKLAGIALMPVAALWYLLVLRQIRFYGIATCYRQGWVTREKVEVTIGGEVLVAEMA